MEFKLPDIGEGVHEGEITKWLVKAGDPIKADEPMVEVMTDKATVEIPSPVTGTIDELFAKEGETVPVGKVILRISEGRASGAAASQPAKPSAAPPPRSEAPKAAAPMSHPEPVRVSAATSVHVTREAVVPDVPFNVLATPATRKLARDLHVDLGSVEGTGPKGRVTKDDVQLAYEGREAAKPRTSHPSASEATAISPSKKSNVPIVRTGAIEKIPLRGIRKRISEAMATSKRTAAHFTYVEEIDMTEVVKLRESVKEEATRRELKITFLPFIIKALIPALKEFPYLNASLDDENQEILLKHDFHLGIATDTPNGLMVPVIHEADRKSIWELAADIADLSEKARTGKATIEELKGGTFTITNAGSIGGVFATPVINYPEVAILGVNAIRKRPMVVEDQIVIRDMMFMSLSVDHRVVDGADAARFMNRLVYFLSEPTRLIFS